MVKGCKKFIRQDLKERELKTTTATTKQRIKKCNVINDNNNDIEITATDIEIFRKEDFS